MDQQLRAFFTTNPTVTPEGNRGCDVLHVYTRVLAQLSNYARY